MRLCARSAHFLLVCGGREGRVDTCGLAELEGIQRVWVEVVLKDTDHRLVCCSSA